MNKYKDRKRMNRGKKNKKYFHQIEKVGQSSHHFSLHSVPIISPCDDFSQFYFSFWTLFFNNTFPLLTRAPNSQLRMIKDQTNFVLNKFQLIFSLLSKHRLYLAYVDSNISQNSKISLGYDRAWIKTHWIGDERDAFYRKIFPPKNKIR